LPEYDHGVLAVSGYLFARPRLASCPGPDTTTPSSSNRNVHFACSRSRKSSRARHQGYIAGLDTASFVVQGGGESLPTNLASPSSRILKVTSRPESNRHPTHSPDASVIGPGVGFFGAFAS